MGVFWSSAELPPFVGMPVLMSMDALLVEIRLEHLRPLLANTELDLCERWLSENHDTFLEKLQKLGMERSDERQVLLNSLLKAKSEGRLVPGVSISSASEVPRIWLISDVHTDHEENMRWLSSLPSFGEDALVVAGDISSEMEVIEETLLAFQQRFGAVFFIPGNHEAWVHSKSKAEENMLTSTDSLQKLEAIRELCQKLRVHISPQLLGGRVWVVPLSSWYDLSLDLAELVPSLAHLTNIERWGDFAFCKWPWDMEQSVDFTWSGYYPVDVSKLLVCSNEDAVNAVNAALKIGFGDSVLSFSHFLPNLRTLPDWMDPGANSFKPQWLDHKAAGDAMRFARVAGSELIDTQLRNITSGVSVQHHVHAFGHSHRPKDFVYNGVRYVNNPVASPLERRRRQVPPKPELKLLWSADGPVPATRILRYWEEHGGVVG